MCVWTLCECVCVFCVFVNEENKFGQQKETPVAQRVQRRRVFDVVVYLSCFSVLRFHCQSWVSCRGSPRFYGSRWKIRRTTTRAKTRLRRESRFQRDHVMSRDFTSCLVLKQKLNGFLTTQVLRKATYLRKWCLFLSPENLSCCFNRMCQCRSIMTCVRCNFNVMF